MIYAIPYLLLYTFFLSLYYRKVALSKQIPNTYKTEKNYIIVALIVYLLFFGLRGYI